MFTPAEFATAAQEEIRIARHLAGKIDSAKIDWRPTPNQRSVRELLQYLTYCGSLPARAIHDDDWGHFPKYRDRAADVDLDSFDRAMQAQEEELNAFFRGLDPAELGRSVRLPWGTETTLGEALYSTTIRFLVAYRMQLFLYAKESGADELVTHNAWLGQDPPPPEEK